MPILPSLPATEFVAQVFPQIPPPVTPSDRLPSPSPPTVKPLPSPVIPSPTPPIIAPDTNTSGTIRVRRFLFQGNTIFTQSQLEAVVASFKNRDINVSDLKQVSEAITKFYTDGGYISSGAIVPPQKIDIQDGSVVIQVLEGKIERINIVGGDRLARYVRERLNAATQPVLQYDRLLEALRLLQRDSRIRRISAALNPGTEPNTRILDVEIGTNPTSTVEIELNNARSPLTGSFERRIQYNNANLLGLGDTLSLDYGNTDGSNRVGAAYTIPINPRNGAVSLNYTWLNSRIIRSPFDALDIRSTFNVYELTFRQPILQRSNERRTQELAVGITASRSDSQSSILGVGFPLSAGSDDQGRTRISALRLFQEYTNSTDQQVLSLRSQFSFGVGAFNSTINGNAPDSRFFTWRGQALWFRRINQTLDLLLRSDLQLSDRSLVPIEQFSLGGPGSVRGYAQNALIGDNGIFGSAELRIHLTRSSAGGLQIIPFIDAGTVWNASGGSIRNNTISSVGVGLQWIQNELQLRANYAIPLATFPNEGNSLQERGFDFSVRYNFSF
ncbi:ShlB/FhaC/HecB family hemolysin secretion/activation protein [Leptolyngbya sp. AN03gr2]|uniref:ShlB/FhaC/HecB family hemolysin secretion/activation protein n=1 Tax=unclassified Leptolyngbya TaxID=2650499 RepID=UPI003D3152A7